MTPLRARPTQMAGISGGRHNRCASAGRVTACATAPAPLMSRCPVRRRRDIKHQSITSTLIHCAHRRCAVALFQKGISKAGKATADDATAYFEEERALTCATCA